MIELVEQTLPGARLKVVGVGGGGGNALNNMVRSGLTGVEFIAANTDSQALSISLADKKLTMGPGLGAGKDPEVGRKFAEESSPEIEKLLEGADMVFITAGMGGGTGTGASPVIARIAKELGALTVAVVTLPFDFEGLRRKEIALKGIEELKEEVHSLIVIPNQRLLKIANRNTTFLDAFKIVDQVLLHAVKAIVDLITQTGLVNVDFADVKTIMKEPGMALMGIGEAEGEERAVEAAHRAISNPLLEDVRIEGARGVLINITGGEDLTLFEVNEATELIRQEVHEQALIIFGAVIEEQMKGKVRVTVIATGFDSIDKRKAYIKIASNQRSDYLDIPTIIRQRQQERLAKYLDEESEADLEIPTFLRKRAD